MRKSDILVYEAQAESGVDLLGAFPSVADAQAYVDYILRQAWWRGYAGEMEVNLRYARRVGTPGIARDRGRFIVTLTLGRLHEGMVLHELAHTVQYRDGRWHRREHGPAFLQAHLLLLDHMVDSIIVDRYRAALRRRSLSWREAAQE